MKFTGSFRHLFERVEKKRIPPPPNRHITGATTGVFSASTKRKRSGRQGAPCLDAGLSAHVPRVRAMKNPARFPGPGLGTLLKDIFLYSNPVSTSRSHKLHRGPKLHDAWLYSASQEIFVGHPAVGVRPMKIPARFPGRAQGCLVAQEQNPAAGAEGHAVPRGPEGLPIFSRVAPWRDGCISCSRRLISLDGDDDIPCGASA